MKKRGMSIEEQVIFKILLVFTNYCVHKQDIFAHTSADRRMRG